MNCYSLMALYQDCHIEILYWCDNFGEILDDVRKYNEYGPSIFEPMEPDYNQIKDIYVCTRIM